MKRLKIILQYNFVYYVLLFIALLLYICINNLDHISVYDNFNKEEFIVDSFIQEKDRSKFVLKGKEKVIGYLYSNSDDYLPGDKVIITGVKQDITNNTVPYQFNYKKYLYSNRIYNVIRITQVRKVETSNSFYYKIKANLFRQCNKLTKSYPYVYSLVLGINDYIDDDILSSYRENGISHLFAISGLHIGVLMYIAYKLLNIFIKNEKLKNTITILFLILYMNLAGTMSVLRAGIFMTLLIINKMLDLNIKPINLLLLTLTIILYINPLHLNSIGLQYSFIITLFIMNFSYLIKVNRIKRIFVVSIISFLASYPITVNNFYEVNFLSAFYNVLFVPLFSFIFFPLVILAFIFPWLDNLVYFFIQVIEHISHYLSHVDILKISLCKMTVIFIVSYYVIICKMFFAKNKKKKMWIAILALFFILHGFLPIIKKDYVMFFDVSQGDAAVISVNNKTIVIDTGGLVMSSKDDYTYSISKNKTLPFLKGSGIKKIDVLILSHGDFDHMGEAKYLVEHFKVEKVIFNCGQHNDLEKGLIKVLEKKEIKYQSCINELSIDNTKLKFLQTREYDNENDDSNVIYTEINNKKFLFTGDAGIDKEQDILEKYNIKDIEVLKVGHHGSKTSSSIEFINEINPKYAVISVGKNNRYGHPNKEVLNTLSNSKVYRTDQNGSIMFKIKNRKLRIETCSP